MKTGRLFFGGYLTLDQEVMAKLDDIWPGPGGEAPEAYAW